MSEVKLLPCPFCGGEARLFETHEHQYGIIHENDDCPIATESFVGGWTYDTKEEAIEAWNTRKPMDKIVAKLEERAKESYEEWKQFDDEGSFGEMLAYEKAIKIVKGEEDE